jgi:hypothetical protein
MTSTLPDQTSLANLTDSGGLGQSFTVNNLNAATTYSFVIVLYRVIDGVWDEGSSSNTKLIPLFQCWSLCQVEDNTVDILLEPNSVFIGMQS